MVCSHVEREGTWENIWWWEEESTDPVFDEVADTADPFLAIFEKLELTDI